MTLQLVQEYEGKWNINRFSSHLPKSDITMPYFSPLRDCGLRFYFKTNYECVIEENILRQLLLKLQLVMEKEPLKGIPSSLLAIMDVKICYSDESILHEYTSLALKDIHKTDKIAFKDRRFSRNCDRIYNDALIIKCNASFYERVLDFALTSESENISRDLIKNFKFIYNPSVLSDFVINIDNKSLLAHKVVLAVHSPVFMRMLTNDFVESKTNSVTITDVTWESFDLFLKYLYSGEIEDKSWSSVKELYYLAHKYDVAVLKDHCMGISKSLLSVDSVCEILKIAYEYEDSKLKSAAKDFALNHVKELVVREDWKELVKSHPEIGYEVAANFFPK